MLGNFSPFCCHLLTFFLKFTFSKNSFSNTIRVSNSLDSDQHRHFVDPELGSNCLQMIQVTASEERVKKSNKPVHEIFNNVAF